MRGAVHAPTHPGEDRRSWRRALCGHPSKHLGCVGVPPLRVRPSQSRPFSAPTEHGPQIPSMPLLLLGRCLRAAGSRPRRIARVHDLWRVERLPRHQKRPDWRFRRPGVMRRGGIATSSLPRSGSERRNPRLARVPCNRGAGLNRTGPGERVRASRPAHQRCGSRSAQESKSAPIDRERRHEVVTDRGLAGRRRGRVGDSGSRNASLTTYETERRIRFGSPPGNPAKRSGL